MPVPTWGNHIPIFQDSGLEVRGYRYFDKETVGLDFEGLKADLKVCLTEASLLAISYHFNRQLQSKLLFCSMLVPTTPLVLILLMHNGPRFRIL